jgi:hypothetical protein
MATLKHPNIIKTARAFVEYAYKSVTRGFTTLSFDQTTGIVCHDGYYPGPSQRLPIINGHHPRKRPETIIDTSLCRGLKHASDCS